MTKTTLATVALFTAPDSGVSNGNSDTNIQSGDNNGRGADAPNASDTAGITEDTSAPSGDAVVIGKWIQKSESRCYFEIIDDSNASTYNDLSSNSIDWSFSASNNTLALNNIYIGIPQPFQGDMRQPLHFEMIKNVTLTLNQDGEYPRLLGTISDGGYEFEFVTEEEFALLTQQVNIGDTIKTDFAELTVEKVEFFNSLSDTIFKPNAIWYNDYFEGTALLVFECSLTNLAKNTADFCELCEFTVDYNDGYLFGENGKGLFTTGKGLSSGNVNCTLYIQDGGTIDVPLGLSSLSTVKYYVAIEVADAVIEDSDAPIILRGRLASSQGYDYFEYAISN